MEQEGWKYLLLYSGFDHGGNEEEQRTGKASLYPTWA